MRLLEGRVVDEAGAGVALASVYVAPAQGQHADIAQLSGEDGTLTMALPPGRFTIGARSDTAGHGETLVDVPSGEGPAIRFTVTLRAGER
ncbi:hypothetical protein [Luteitalea sp.]|uniref:hypothetical protein n=1 Tax=Luteitalea sp. TaxID=2004800 RepID=UPI0037C7C443